MRPMTSPAIRPALFYSDLPEVGVFSVFVATTEKEVTVKPASCEFDDNLEVRVLAPSEAPLEGSNDPVTTKEPYVNV